MRVLLSILIAALAALASAAPVYDGFSGLTLTNAVLNGHSYVYNSPANSSTDPQARVTFSVAHVYGAPFERGQAYGRLFKKQILAMMREHVPRYFNAQNIGPKVANEYLPRHMQERLKAARGDATWPAMYEAMEWVYAQQEYYLAADPAKPLDALKGLAIGLCDGDKTCDVAEMIHEVSVINIFPEFVRMGCSIVGSWGPANDPSCPNLIQLRALDFGDGPWANNHVVLVEHPDNGNAFASLSFYGIMGVVTSISEKITQTEKLFMNHQGFQPGTYDGHTAVFVIRRIMELANTKEEAHEIIKNTYRTWSIFLGFGDREQRGTAKPMNIIGYKHESAFVYDDTNITMITEAPVMPGVIHVDRHPQPSKESPMATMLAEKIKEGGIDTKFILHSVPAPTNTGDVHMQLFDGNTDTVYYSIGLTDNDFAYVERGKAMYRPWVAFNITALLSEKKPRGLSYSKLPMLRRLLN